MNEIYKPIAIPNRDLIKFPVDIQEMIKNAMQQKYYISNYGNVYSILNDRPLKQIENEKGYLRVELSYSSKIIIYTLRKSFMCIS